MAIQQKNTITTMTRGRPLNLKDLIYFHVRNLALDLRIRDGHSDYCKFIILTRGRSGSNFLRGLLNSHNQIVTFGELFRSYGSIGWDFPDYDQYLQSQSLKTLMQNNPDRFLKEKVFKKFPKQILAVGFKIFYYHAQNDSRKTVWTFLRNQKNLKVIHLKRNNTLKVLLSLKRAFKTNKWTDITGSGEEDFAISLSYEECLHEFTWAQEIKKEYDIYFKDNHKIDVFYENLSRHHESEVRRIQEFLGVSCEIVKPSTYKQSKQPLSKVISNYFELKKKFKGTLWEEFFED
jgi:LPS sulfotransferase NodH